MRNERQGAESLVKLVLIVETERDEPKRKE